MWPVVTFKPANPCVNIPAVNTASGWNIWLSISEREKSCFRDLNFADGDAKSILLMLLLRHCWLVDNFFLIQVQVYFVDVHCVFLAQKRWSTEEVKWKKINKNCEISLAGTISQLFAQIALEGFPRLNWICPSQGCFVFYIVRTW